MALFQTSATPNALTLRVLSCLLRYPDAELREHLSELRGALHAEHALPAPRLAELDALIERLQHARALDTEASYVELFDRGRGTALHLFEHVHGDSRDRGPAMIDLKQTYEQAGLLMREGELPDHLAVVLEFASTQPPAQAASFLREFSHILQIIFSALLKRQSPYASAVAALLDLTGEKAQAVKLPEEPPLDESWEEPLAFGGCSTQGQARPGQPQPIHVVRTPPGPQGARA
jgi:nitrate reductase delta subunit